MGDRKFQKSRHKEVYDRDGSSSGTTHSSSGQTGSAQGRHAGHFAELDDDRKKQIEELEAILDKSKDFLSEKDIKNIKKLLSKLNKKLLQQLKEALINKQMSKFRAIENLHEDDDIVD